MANQADAAPAQLRAFVGREAELAELVHGLDEACAGRGRLYLLCGEPGIGKTRLADELSARAVARGMGVHWGRCWEAGGAPAYWPWLDVLSGLTEELEAALSGEALGDGAFALAELVPTLRTRLGALSAAVSASAEEARFRLFRAAALLLRRAAAARGALIVLEDLHSADESSLLLLRFVARELRAMRVFVLATFRDVEARLTPEIGAALGLLSREGTTLVLPRLGAAEAQRFLSVRAARTAPEVREILFRRTQGNPLFLEEMARLLASAGSDTFDAQVLPAGVREVLRQRLARVPSEARALLDAVAVCGDEVEPAFVAETTGLADARVRELLDRCVHAGVLIPRDAVRLRFSHALVREVIESDLARERAQELHGKVAEALERHARSGAEPKLAELAHHWLAGPQSALAHAVGWAIRAAERDLTLFAFEAAGALLEHARQAVSAAGGEPRLLAEVLIALAHVHVRRGKGALGRSLCLDAIRIGRELADAQLLASAALAFGLEITAALVDTELVALLEEALGALPKDDSPIRARVLARLGAALQPHRDLLHPIALAREGIACARRLGDADTLLYTLFTGMAAFMDIVDPRERLPLNLEVEQLASGRTDRERLLRTQIRLVFDHMELGDLAGADARIELFERLAREAGARRYLWRVPLFRSMRAMMHGRFVESEQLLEEARRLGEAAEDPQLERCIVFHREGLLRAWERHEDMVAYDVEARRMRAALYSGPHWQNGGSAFTHARVEDLDKARLYIDLVPQDDWPIVHNPPAFMHLGEPLALVGSAALVERLYDMLLPASHRSISWGFTKFVWDGTATRVLALLAARLGRFEQADVHFEQALTKLEQLDARPYLARTRYEYGRSLQGRDDGRARALIEQAGEQAEQLGMRGLARLARARLAVPERGTSPSGAPRQAQRTGPPFELAPEGEYWTVSYGAVTFRLKDSLGVAYLARLVREPDRSIHVLELSGGKAEDGAALDLGDGGELLDDVAVAKYRARVSELREDLAEAERFDDLHRAEQLREELEFLAAELSRGVGLGGKRRRGGGAGERARSAVQRRIRNAIERIREHSPELAQILERSVKTGTYCVFRAADLG